MKQIKLPIIAIGGATEAGCISFPSGTWFKIRVHAIIHAILAPRIFSLFHVDLVSDNPWILNGFLIIVVLN